MYCIYTNTLNTMRSSTIAHLPLMLLPPTFTVADTVAPFEHFARNGYYTVGNKIYSHKIYALQAATQQKLPVQWHFNEDTFNKFDWTVRPSTPLTELYRLRAQQLRQKYDYLILLWSGGADSTNILDTFLLNNISIDEVVVLWPVTQTQGRYTPNLSTEGDNMNSEWDYAIKPKIEWLKKHHPHVRITVQDFLVDPNKKEDVEDTVTVTEKHGYVTIQKYRAFDALLEDRSENHNVGVMVGVGPVDIMLLDNYVAVHFIDSALTGPKADYTLRGCPRHIEYFYWTPELPELISEQGHIMLNHLRANPSSRRCVSKMHLQPDLTYKASPERDHEVFRSLRKSLLYPTWDNNILQVKKAKDTHYYLNWYSWFYDNPHSNKYLNPWRSAIASHHNLIDPKYFEVVNGVVGSYKNFLSKFYILGKL